MFKSPIFFIKRKTESKGALITIDDFTKSSAKHSEKIFHAKKCFAKSFLFLYNFGSR